MLSAGGSGVSHRRRIVILPVRNVPGWRAFRFPPGLWAAPRRVPGAAAGAEEAGDGGTSPWRPDVYGLPL